MRLNALIGAAVIGAATPALAIIPAPNILSYEQKLQICSALKTANNEGISGKSMLINQYGRAATAGIMADIKSTCPRVY